MTFMRLLSDGFRAARRHPRLVLIAYLVPLLPALLLVAMARSTLAPVFDYSLFAQKVLDGSWMAAWQDFTSSPANHMSVILGSGVTLAMLLTFLVQIPVAAGTVEVLLAGETPEPHPFLTGVAQHTWRFARSAVWYLVAFMVAMGITGGTVATFFKLAEKTTNARYDVIGFGVAALLAFLVLAVVDQAYDQARLAAACHDERKTFRGFFRAIRAVLLRPGMFLPLAASFLVLTLGLHLLYYAARSPWTPATAAAIAALLVAQQLVMAVRATFQVAFWGAELAAYRTLGEPRFCEKRQKKLLVIDEPPAEPAAEESAPAVDAAGEPVVDTAISLPALPDEPVAAPAADPFPIPAADPADDVFTPAEKP